MYIFFFFESHIKLKYKTDMSYLPSKILSSVIFVIGRWFYSFMISQKQKILISSENVLFMLRMGPREKKLRGNPINMN